MLAAILKLTPHLFLSDGGFFERNMLIFAYIIGVLTLSSMIVITYTHKYKKKNEILPILSVFVFLLLGKVMRVLFEFNFIKIILLSSLYLFLLALGIRKFSSNNK